MLKIKRAMFERIRSVYFDKTFIFIAILLYSLIMVYLFKIPYATLVLFIFYNIVLIILPGVAILILLEFRTSWFMMLCLSYAVGYAVNIGEYFLSEIFDRELSATCLSLSVGLVSLIIIILKVVLFKENIVKNSEEDSSLVFQELFLILFLFVNVFAYSANYLGTDVNGIADIPRDMQYWCNNSVSLMIKFPADTLFMQGKLLSYHYFSSIQIAFFSIVSGIDIFTLSFPFFSLTKTFILVGAVVFMMNILCADDKWKIIGMILVLCTTGLEDVVCVTFLPHTLLMPFGFDIGFAYGCYFISLMVKQWKIKKFNFTLWFLICLFWSVCVGAKAPIASILLLIPGLFCLFWLIKREWRLSLGYGIPILGLFLIINIACTGMISVFQGTGSWTLDLYTIQDIKTLGGGGV